MDPCSSDWRARFPGVTDADWRDWRWQLRHALRTEADLGRLVDLTADGAGRPRPGRPAHRRDALLRRAHGPAPPGLPGAPPGHPAGAGGRGAAGRPRGPDRRGDRTGRSAAVVQQVPRPRPASWSPTPARSTAATAPAGASPAARRGPSTGRPSTRGSPGWRPTPRCRDVIVSGGDPLVLSDERLDEVLGRLRAIPHVRLLRLATRGAGGPPHAHRRRPGRHAAPPRPALRGDPLQPPQGADRRGAPRPARRWWTTACRWRTRRSCCAASTPRRGPWRPSSPRCSAGGSAPTTCTRATWWRGPATSARRSPWASSSCASSAAGWPAWPSRSSRSTCRTGAGRSPWRPTT